MTQTFDSCVAIVTIFDRIRYGTNLTIPIAFDDNFLCLFHRSEIVIGKVGAEELKMNCYSVSRV